MCPGGTPGVHRVYHGVPVVVLFLVLCSTKSYTGVPSGSEYEYKSTLGSCSETRFSSSEYESTAGTCSETRFSKYESPKVLEGLTLKHDFPSTNYRSPFGSSTVVQ